MTAKDLKNALLQEAIQGKLVPQIASEGNARDLLEEIRKEKLSHGLDFANAKSGKRKSKKETALVGSNPCDITEEEIPFDIPENWCWCRLSEYLDIRDGTHDSPKFYDNGIPFVTSKNLNDGILDFSTCKYITEEDHKKFSARSFVEDGDILFAMIGSIGNPVIVKKKFDFSFKNMALFKRYTKEKTDMKYIFYYLSYIQFELKRIATGGVQSFIGLGTFREMLFPLPPLSEQKRIVAAIEKFMPLIEEYGKKETQLKAINEKIGTLTKKAILQEAVQGKLVPQIASEGNARDLLEEIRKERLSHGLDFANAKSGKRKSKKETALAGSNPCDIKEEEIPFDIPENWCWCRLGEICNEIKRGKSPKYADKSNFLAFAQKCNVKTGGIDLGLALYLDENSITRYSETDNLVQGDIVINSTGGGTMGRVGLYETQVPAGIKGVYPDSHVTVIRSIGNINQHYLYYVLKLNQPVLEKCGTGSTNQTELKPAVLADFVIPLPPLAEQKRIVAAIEKMLPLCEKLGE